MYAKGHGIITTLAPLHVGATAGEESGNLNLIFRDPYTQTGIIPGSSIRGRFRAEMRYRDPEAANLWYGNEAQKKVKEEKTGEETEAGTQQDRDPKVTLSESKIKFEYASIVWLPVFCPGFPIVWVSCPRLLKRYQRIANKKDLTLPEKYVASQEMKDRKNVFFNFGFLNIKDTENLTGWFPDRVERAAIVVDDNEIGMVHDMALFRQSRVKLDDDEKKVDGGAFFNTEALPEETILAFPLAARKADDLKQWQPFGKVGQNEDELYLGGLESIGFGHCSVKIKISEQ
jgi:CRISPR-associated protein Cmr4